MKKLFLLIFSVSFFSFAKAQDCSVGGNVSASQNVLCSGNSTTIQLSGSVGTIQWQESNDSFIWSNVTGGSGHVTSTYTTPKLTSTKYYRAKVVSGACSSVYSDTAKIQIDSLTKGGVAVSSTGSVCENSATTIYLTASTGVIQWQQSSDGMGNWSNVPGATQVTYSTSPLTSETYYRAVVKNGVCVSQNSSVVSVKVDPLTVSGTISGSATVCSGNNSGTLNLTGYTGNIVRWESSIDNFATTSFIVNSSSTLNYLNIATSIKYRAVIESGVCPMANTPAALITVNEGLSAGILSASQNEICYKTTPGIIIGTVPTGGNGFYSYQWQESNDSILWNDIMAESAEDYSPGPLLLSTYFRRVVASGACPSSVTVPILIKVINCGNADVWPGDANNDGLADKYDLLPIGLNSGITGIPRASKNILWQAHISSDWSGSSNGVNLKHVDCNGDGAINEEDTLAILQNYGLTHNKTENITQYNSANPDLYFVIPNTPATAGNIINAEIWVGKTSVPVSSLYGLGFRVGYDANYVEEENAVIEFSDSWLADSKSSYLTIDTTLVGTNFVDAAIVRTDQLNQSGYGKIADLKLKLKKDLNEPSALNLTFVDYKAIDALGSSIAFNAINNIVTGAKTIVSESDFNVYPNPNNGNFEIAYSGNEAIKISIFNVLGENVFTINHLGQEPHKQIELESIPVGVYLLKVNRGQQIITKRIVIN